MKTSKIIFLNGHALAGKVTLAKAIQEVSEELFLYIGIDVLFGRTPRKIVCFGKEAEKGFQYIVDQCKLIWNIWLSNRHHQH